MSKEKLYIIGAGSVGVHIALNIAEYSKKYAVAGFFDDDREKIGTHQYGIKVLGNVDEAHHLKNGAIVVGIAFPRTKQKIIERLASNPSLYYPTLIHERAWISNGVSIGKGCVIYPGTTINFGSKIDDFVVLNVNCSLGHHTVVGTYSSFAPGVKTGGHTIFEEGVDVGIGVSTIQKVVVGAKSIIGGQSMLINPVRPGSTVAGIPARELTRGKIISNPDV